MSESNTAKNFSTISEKAKNNDPSGLSDLYNLFSTQVAEFGKSKGLNETETFVNNVLEKSYESLKKFEGRQADFTYIVCILACEDIKTIYPQTALQLSQTQEHVAVLRVFFGLTKQQTAYAMDLTLKQVNTIEELTRANLKEYVSKQTEEADPSNSEEPQSPNSDEIQSSEPHEETSTGNISLYFDDLENSQEPDIEFEEPADGQQEPTAILPIIGSSLDDEHSVIQFIDRPDSIHLTEEEKQESSNKKLLLIPFLILILFTIGFTAYSFNGKDKVETAKATQNSLKTSVAESSLDRNQSIYKDSDNNASSSTNPDLSELSEVENIDQDENQNSETNDDQTSNLEQSPKLEQEPNADPKPELEPNPEPNPEPKPKPEPEPEPFKTNYSGTILQSSGKAAQNVEISLSKQGRRYSTKTSSSGKYTFLNVEEGCYTRTTNVSNSSSTLCIKPGAALPSSNIYVGLLTSPPQGCEVQYSNRYSSENAGVEVHSTTGFASNYQFRDSNQRTVAETRNMGNNYERNNPFEREYNAALNGFDINIIYFVTSTNQYGISPAVRCERK